MLNFNFALHSKPDIANCVYVLNKKKTCRIISSKAEM